MSTKKISKKEKEQRSTLILVLLLVLLLILIVIIIATKTNQGRMKDRSLSNGEVIALPEGTYYQDKDDKDIYLRVNSYKDGNINFDFKADQLYESINAVINNNTGIAELDSNNGPFKIKINIAEDIVELLVYESNNEFYQEDESYIFER